MWIAYTILGALALITVIAAIGNPKWFAGESRDDKEKIVDHSLHPNNCLYRCPPCCSVDPHLLRPLLERALEAYRFGPPEGQVYWMLREVEEEMQRAIENGHRVGISHEERYFITRDADGWEAMIIEAEEWERANAA